MAGQERRMMWQGVAEALANLGLSIGLTWWTKSILGVALGSVIPTLLFGWGLIWGWAAREAGQTRRQLFGKVVVKTWLGCLPMVGLAVLLRWQPWWRSGSNTWLVLAEGTLVGLAGLAGLWQFTLGPAERDRLKLRFARKQVIFPKGKPA
jgi:hypothetical protein